MYCLWWTANGAKALSYSFGASADLTWRGLGMGKVLRKKILAISTQLCYSVCLVFSLHAGRTKG